MTSTAKLATFDPAVGSTVDVGLDNGVKVPDATKFMKDTVFISLMTPMGDPNDPLCIWGAPSIYWGIPATAKSSRTRQAANEANLAYQLIFPANRQPEEFSGVLVPTKDGVVLECMLRAVHYLNKIGRGVIVLEECNNASKATESALLGFVQDRVAGDVTLSPGIRIISTANPPEYSVNGYQMSPATANRYCHFQVKSPPHRDVLNHVMSGGKNVRFDAKNTEELIKAKWANNYAHALSMWAGYMESCSGLSMHHEPPVDHPQSGFCWASSRSWETGMRMKATGEILGYSEEITNACVEGCIGEAIAFDFMTWVRNADLPLPADVLKNGWTPDFRRLDVAFAVLASVTAYVVNSPTREMAIDNAIGAWKLYGVFLQHNMGDMIVSAAVTLVNKNLSRKAGNAVLIETCDPVIAWMAKNKLLNYVEA